MKTRAVGRAAGVTGLALLGLLAAAPAADAQHRPSDPAREGYEVRQHESAVPRGWFDVHAVGGDPVGEFGQKVGVGFGLDFGGALAFGRSGAFRLRADGGFLVYGHDEQTVCMAPPIGCRIAVDLTTSNSIVFLGIGPEVVVPTGPVRPYANGAFGFSYFSTTSSLSGEHDSESFAETRNYDDLVGAVRAGGGVRIPLGGSMGRPVLLDLGVQYHRNGVAEYLREGDIIDHPDGSITLLPNRTEANLLSYRVGVSIGLGGGYDDDHHDRDDRDRHGRGW